VAVIFLHACGMNSYSGCQDHFL